MNPFEVNTMPIDTISDLLYREQEINQIKKHVDSRKQTVILGVEGVGKTSLLQSVFNRDYRIQKAIEGTLISPVTEFPSDLKDEDIYIHFAEMVINSVRILAQCNKADEMDIILRQCKDIRNEGHSANKYFELIMNLIHSNYGYRVVMVVDNFERFTSSREVTMKHHETLRKLLVHSQYIVATNYDLNVDSLPKNVSGSLYLMNFAGNEIRVGGWSPEQTTQYIREQLQEGGIQFSDHTIQHIHSVTGGIPLLFKLAANYTYEYIHANQSEEGLKLKPLYDDNEMVQTLFFRWCKMLTPMQITALKHMLDDAYDSEIDQTKLRCLYLRGVLDYEICEDMFGNKIVSNNKYQFCCKFLDTFCRDESNLELAASQNPLRVADDEEITPDADVREPSPENTDTIAYLRDEIVKIATVKTSRLETQAHELWLQADDDTKEYMKLGSHISDSSARLTQLRNQRDTIGELRDKIRIIFDGIYYRLTSATTPEELTAIKENMEARFGEVELQLQEIRKGTVA